MSRALLPMQYTPRVSIACTAAKDEILRMTDGFSEVALVLDRAKARNCVRTGRDRDVRDRETERQRCERQRDRDVRDRETDRQRDREKREGRETERQRDRETERQRDRETEM